jgi:hypothetical protein
MVEVFLWVVERFLAGIPAAFKCIRQVWYHVPLDIIGCTNL